MTILQGWLNELLRFSGYSIEEVFNLSCWIIDLIVDIMQHTKDSRTLLKVRGIKKKLPNLLGFIRRLHSLMEIKAAERNIPGEAYRILYHLRTHAKDTAEYFHLNRRVDRLLKNRRQSAEEDLEGMIRITKRASSLVENLNSRIRQYINLKRVVPKRFFILMKVFFNTKKYRRSAVDGRIGKSPIELMSGRQYPDFFELLGF